MSSGIYNACDFNQAFIISIVRRDARIVSKGDENLSLEIGGGLSRRGTIQSETITHNVGHRDDTNTLMVVCTRIADYVLKLRIRTIRRERERHDA